MRRKRLFILFVLIAGGTGAILVVLLSQRNVGLYKITMLPSLGGEFVFADAINDHGRIVGTSTVPGGAHHLFLWDPNRRLVPLGACVPRGTGMRLVVRDLNNRGCIVGFLFDAAAGNRHRAVLLEPIPERWDR